MKESLEKACFKRQDIKNIKHVGHAALEANGRIVTTSVKEAIRIEDANKSLWEHIEYKFPHNNQFVNVDSRNTFEHEEVTALVIKCAHRHNHCEIRDLWHMII